MTQPSAPAETVPPHAETLSPTTSLICLTGFMGSGKTVVGAELARSLGYGFTDLDQVVETRAGRSIAQIFSEQGEAAFRRAEAEALASVLSTHPRRQVVALGGGAFVDSEAVELLQSSRALVVFLDADAEVLYRRCVDSLGAASRPLLKDLPSFKKLYAERWPAYAKAPIRIDTNGLSAMAVVEKIRAVLLDRPEAGHLPQRKS